MEPRGIGAIMIAIHKLNGQEVFINAELIESLEHGKETIVCLATGNRFLVRENVEEIVQKVIDYRKKVNAGPKAVNPIAGFERQNP